MPTIFFDAYRTASRIVRMLVHLKLSEVRMYHNAKCILNTEKLF